MKIGDAIQQGEVYIRRIEQPGDMEGLSALEKTDKGFILSHSENGNHHMLTGGNVLERPNAPKGMQMLYAIVETPEKIIQDATVPHKTYDLPKGFYDIRISREHDPFTQQARQVAD